MIAFRIILSLVMCTFLSFASATDAEGLILVSKQTFYPGDEIVVELEWAKAGAENVLFPENHPQWKGLTPLGTPEKTKEIKLSDKTIYQKSYKYIALDSLTGELQLDTNSKQKNLTLTYEEGKKKKSYAFATTTVNVQRIPVDTTQALRAEYAPLPVQMKPRPWYFWLLFLIPLAIILGIYFWVKRKKRAPLSIPENMDPQAWAVGEIKKLQQLLPFESATQKKQVTHLSAVIRLFLEKKSGFPALYKSSEEILAFFEAHEKFAALHPIIEPLLLQTDKVKFAGKKLISEEESQLLKDALAITQLAIWKEDKKVENKGGVHV